MKLNYTLCAALLAGILASSISAQDKSRSEDKREMRTWLGVATDPVHPGLRQHLELQEGFGIQISHIQEDSPADKSGLKAGDVLSKLDDQLLTSPQHLAVLVRSKNKGDAVELTYLRKGATESTTATLGESEMAKLQPQRPIHQFRSPDQWKDMHNQMRRQSEEMQRRFQDMHRSRVQERPKLEDRGRQQSDKKPGRGTRGSAPKPMIQNESTVKIDNDQGEVVISQKNGRGQIEILDSEGTKVYSGPYDVSKGIKGLPENAQDHLKEMKVDNIDMLSPTPIPVMPKPAGKEEKKDDDLL